MYSSSRGACYVLHLNQASVLVRMAVRLEVQEYNHAILAAIVGDIVFLSLAPFLVGITCRVESLGSAYSSPNGRLCHRTDDFSNIALIWYRVCVNFDGFEFFSVVRFRYRVCVILFRVAILKPRRAPASDARHGILRIYRNGFEGEDNNKQRRRR